MSALSNVVERFLFRVGPAGIVIGYVLALFGVVAGWWRIRFQASG